MHIFPKNPHAEMTMGPACVKLSGLRDLKLSAWPGGTYLGRFCQMTNSSTVSVLIGSDTFGISRTGSYRLNTAMISG